MTSTPNFFPMAIRSLSNRFDQPADRRSDAIVIKIEIAFGAFDSGDIHERNRGMDNRVAVL